MFIWVVMGMRVHQDLLAGLYLLNSLALHLILEHEAFDD